MVMQKFSYHIFGFGNRSVNIPFYKYIYLNQVVILSTSYIEFYRNGKSCGIAFTDIYAGFYYPAVSLFQGATVRCNFGPSFRYPVPHGARGMCERVGEMYIEQTLADILYLVENEDELAEEAAKCARNL
ncbi:unnamed protein product [Brugia timori]|uniref:Uncharacterized protein n=1 Tax=Brugia timori TaxID=42155 RepID=A0A3P7XY87_9BILA|nr:unnamed protein product [Brugia timori]